jgi:excisionase family DNA binding protein
MEKCGTGGLLNVQEAAAYLGLGSQTIYNWCSQGLLIHIKLGRRVLFRLSDLEEFVQGKVRGGRRAKGRAGGPGI